MTYYQIHAAPRPTLKCVAIWLEYQAAAIADHIPNLPTPERARLSERADALTAAAEQIRKISAGLKRAKPLAAAIEKAYRYGTASIIDSHAMPFEALAGAGSLCDLERLYSIAVTRTNGWTVITNRHCEPVDDPPPDPDLQGAPIPADDADDHDHDPAELKPTEYDMPQE